MSEKPLHVQVAEALGWVWLHRVRDSDSCCWLHPPDTTERPTGQIGIFGEAVVINSFSGVVGPLKPCDRNHAHTQDGMSRCPRYDTDWSATGPLIERFKVDVGYEGDDTRGWTACVNYPEGLSWEDAVGAGATPLHAVCELILRLSAAGKLVSEEASKPSGQER